MSAKKMRAVRRPTGLKGTKFKIAKKRIVSSAVAGKAAADRARGRNRDSKTGFDSDARQREYTKRTRAREKGETARFKEAQKTERTRIKKDSKLQAAAGTALKTTSATTGAAQNVAAARGDENISDITAALVKADASGNNAGAIQDDGDQGRGTSKGNPSYPGYTSPDGNKSKADQNARSTADPRQIGLII